MALTLPKASDIKAKLGPFPVWVWGVIVGGIILVVVYYRNNAAKAAAAGTDTSGVTVSGEDLTAALGATDDGTTDTTDDTTDATSSTTLGSTNTTWESSAVAWLSSHGYSPLTAQNAVENYLNGTLSSTDAGANSAVNAAITNYGLPPDGVFGIPAVPVVSTPVTTTTTPPATAVSTWYQLNGAPGHQTIYKVTSGKRVSQSSAQWKAAGSPHLTAISAANLNKLSKP